MEKKNRDYRIVTEFELRNVDLEGLFVEGYALTFDEPTVLFEYEGKQYKEVIDRHALINADMSDVIFNYNHSGKVMARTRNKTLELQIDQRGLRVKAKLDGTEEGRKLFEEIRGGYIDRMSFSFRIEDEEYDKKTLTRKLTKINKIYDVSAVDIPAYDTTTITARSYFLLQNEMIEKRNLQRKKLILISKL